MSGTSADGIDLALIHFDHEKPALKASFYQEYPAEIHQKIIALYQTSDDEIELMGSLDIELAQYFASAVNEFINQQSLKASDIIAIGNHGQTIRHRPPNGYQQHAFTLQIGCNETLAALTGIRVIGQFRRKDIAHGGQGAPLVPAFHKALLSDDEPLFVVNIGGIANITYLPNDTEQAVIGFDTGPGNALLDIWYQAHNPNVRYDEGGNWSSTGTVIQPLLNHLLEDKYFKLPPPKSTGREYFHAQWLNDNLSTFEQSKSLLPQDIQATLCALTAGSISEQIRLLSTTGKVFLCGGGAHNKYLLNLIKQQLNNHTVAPLSALNIDGDALEAMAFAWFAYAFDKKITGNIPSVTGASKALVLGNEYLA